MNEDINELIDKNLNLIIESNESQFMITNFVGSNGRKLSLHVNAARFASTMESNGLITVNGDFAYVEEFGLKVYKSGGWINYQIEKDKIETQKTIDLKYKENLELEKTHIDLELAKRMLNEYPKTKWFARLGFGIAISLAILEIVKLIIQLRSKC